MASLLGIWYIKWKGSDEPGKALNTGTYVATILFAGLAALLTLIMVIGLTGEEASLLWKLCGCAVIGLFAGIILGLTSDYFTRDDKKPTRKVAEAAQEGHAVVILSGISYGLLSVVPPAIGIVVAMVFAYLLGGVFGVAMAAVGMLAIVGTIVSNDAYGPIVDNARAIAEQGDLGDDIIRTADRLDSAGNTAKAITKGFAIGAANLTVFALLFSFVEEARAKGATIDSINLLNVNVLVGAFIGVVIPALFSALLILAVQKPS